MMFDKSVAVLVGLVVFPFIASGDITSADLKQCPDGHRTLKDVPIYYGLSTMSPKEIHRHVKNLDFVMGGCEVDENSPKVRPTCTTCGFSYNSRSKRWSRKSRDIRSFKRAFTPMLTSFPLLQRTKTLEYEQSVGDKGVVAEGVVYTAKRDHPELKSEIDQWFNKHGVKFQYDEPKEGDRLVRQWHAQHISIRFSYEPSELFVWLVHDLEREKIDVL